MCTAVLDAIGNAKTSVDIVVYEMNAPGINDALVDAVKRGVDVRVILNGQWWSGRPQPDPTYYKLQFAYDLSNEVAPAASGAGAGTFRAHWASNNFNITHQKTVVIDAVDADGKQFASAADLPDTASTVILTGNLDAYKYDPSDPSTCPQPCNFYGARDFYLTVTDPNLVLEVEKVFSSDFTYTPR